MPRLLRIVAVATFVVLAPFARADSHWPNTCDPETQFDACGILAIFYEHGPQFFPKDVDRAQALRAGLRAVAFRRCIEGDGQACGPAAQYVMSDTGLDAAARLDHAAQAFAAMEQHCRAGDADMCAARVWLSYASEFLALRAPVDQAAAQTGAPGWNARFGQTDAWASVEIETRKTAFASASKACAGGDKPACVEAARLHVLNPKMSGMSVDLTVTAPLLDACLAGDDALCGLLAFTFAKMKQEAPNRFADAARRLSDACTAGASAPCHIASHFAGPEQRQPLFEAACAAGDGRSCGKAGNNSLSAWMKAGKADAALLERATTLFTEGCALGDPIACHTLEHLTNG